jgi:23S rRNA pseudouridine2605 synthase
MMLAARRRRPRAPSPSSPDKPRAAKPRGANRGGAPNPGAPVIAPERLQKALSRAGHCSRRAAEELVRQGKVKVNGNVVAAQGMLVGGGDVVEVEGRVVSVGGGGMNGGVGGGGRPEWIALHKPKGVLCAVQDQRGRKTVADFLKRRAGDGGGRNVAVVGRLEAGASGLVLLTNEKGCVAALEGRACGHVREFEVTVTGHVTADAVGKLRQGVAYGEGERRVATLPADVDVLESGYDVSGLAGGSVGKPVKVTVMNFRVREARQRMIGRMCEAVGHELVGLKSVAFGPVRLSAALKKGVTRPLTPNEVKALKRGVNPKLLGDVRGGARGGRGGQSRGSE